MSSQPTFPSFPISGITIPSTPLTRAAYAFVKENTSAATLNHCLRSTAFALISTKKLPQLSDLETAGQIDVEALVLSTLLHDMGWATTKSLLSSDKRFEVDGANIARAFITSSQSRAPEEHEWDKHRVQLVWDAIALHTTPTIARHKEPEVVATQSGIIADFFGPKLQLDPAAVASIITVDEYKEVVTAFPRLGFKDAFIDIMCGLCRDKRETTFDNFVAWFGANLGLDGKGTDKDAFRQEWERSSRSDGLLKGLDDCKQWE